MSVDTTNIEVDEDLATTFGISFTGAQGEVVLSLSITGNIAGEIDFVQQSNTSAIVTVTAPEIDFATRVGQVEVNALDDDGREQTAILNLTFLNTSADNLIANSVGIPDLAETMTFSIERELFQRYQDALVLSGNTHSYIDGTTVKQIGMLVNAEDIHHLNERIVDFTDKVDAYNNNLRSENSLRTDYYEVVALAITLAEPVGNFIQESAEATSGLFEVPLTFGLYYDANSPEGYRFSQFIGNPELGQYDEQGAWQFREQFAYLRDVT